MVWLVAEAVGEKLAHGGLLQLACGGHELFLHFDGALNSPQDCRNLFLLRLGGQENALVKHVLVVDCRVARPGLMLCYLLIERICLERVVKKTRDSGHVHMRKLIARLANWIPDLARLANGAQRDTPPILRSV